MSKPQIPALHKNLKSFILKSQIPWPTSPNLSLKLLSQDSKSQLNPKSQFFHKYINMNYDLYNRKGN